MSIIYDGVTITIPINDTTMEAAIDVGGELCIRFSNDYEVLNIPIGKPVLVPEWVVKAAEFGGLI